MARVAVATSISPNELMDAPPEVFWAMVKVLEEQQEHLDKARRKH